MTLCAGICSFSPAGGCRIRLSEPVSYTLLNPKLMGCYHQADAFSMCEITWVEVCACCMRDCMLAALASPPTPTQPMPCAYLCPVHALQLLKYRPVKDLKETLLHEMIHAYMFLVCAVCAVCAKRARATRPRQNPAPTHRSPVQPPHCPYFTTHFIFLKRWRFYRPTQNISVILPPRCRHVVAPLWRQNATCLHPLAPCPRLS